MFCTNSAPNQREYKSDVSTYSSTTELYMYIFKNYSSTSLLARSMIGEGRGCNDFVPVLRGNGTKVAPTGDIFDQPPGQMR